jgi:hypothetical protein
MYGQGMCKYIMGMWLHGAACSSGWPHALQGRAVKARKRGEGPTRAPVSKSAQQSTDIYTVLDDAEKLKMGFLAVTFFLTD